MAYKITNDRDSSNKNYINQLLYEYNVAHFPEDLRGRYEELHLFVRDETGKVLGGLLGEFCWNWLEIDTLMVEEEIRRHGFGSKLLKEAERIAREKQCDFIKVDTLSFQALPFYEKHGYEVYGTIDNVGRDHKHYYLKKSL